MCALNSISPVDGRYQSITQPLSCCFSEKALMSLRVLVECRYLLCLSETSGLGLRRFTAPEKKLLSGLHAVSDNDAVLIKQLETKGAKNIPPTKHDVKAVEYFIKGRLLNSSLKDCAEWVHFSLTSEDINNIAYAVALSRALRKVILPCQKKILSRLEKASREFAGSALLARTHGQPAVPTTFGKEFRVFAERLKRQILQLENAEILAKLNGASGNYNAHFAAYPGVDWIKFTKKFISGLGGKLEMPLAPNLFTTQIEPHDNYAEIFDNLRRSNMILLDFCQDMWRYISCGLMKQKAQKGEIGSSTMPQKINPINFENAEGNLGMANSLFGFFSAKLPVSRLQRDLSDSTVERNFGTALSHCLIAYESILEGLSKTAPDTAAAMDELNSHPEITAEGIQTILRREKVKYAYEKLKDLTRGRKTTACELHSFIDGMDISRNAKNELKKLSPQNYTGLAEKLANRQINRRDAEDAKNSL